MKGEGEVGGIIYPLKKHNFFRLKNSQKPVYVKYVGRSEKYHYTKLQSGNKLLFYQSSISKSIVGYGTIISIAFLLPKDIQLNYIDRIQMDMSEFESYCASRLNTQLIFIELDQVTELTKPIKLDYHVTMGGKYLSEEEINIILNSKISY
jgi:hypothetical protein